MPSFEVEFEVYCDCGVGLCLKSTGSNGRGGPRVTVEPCEKCIESAKGEGYYEGFEDGCKESKVG
jgi:hypothetical protein